MKRAVVVLVGALLSGSVLTAEADGTTLTASPDPSVVGQTVTFRATFAHYCSDGVDSAIFTIDGTTYRVGWSGDPGATSTLSISTLSAGPHRVTFAWSASQPGTTIKCGDAITITQTVNPKPIPPPPPPSKGLSSPLPPSPSESSPSATPLASPSPVQPSAASPERPRGDPTTAGGAPLAGVFAIGAAVLLLGVALAAMLVWRR